MIKETKDRFVVEENGKCYGKYRTRIVAEARLRQVWFSQRPSKKGKKR